MQELKVLLVDDEEEFVTTLAERLSLRGMATRIATDGEQALRAVEADPPHVVVLDLMMPGIKGTEALRRIKAGHPTVQVILLTGHGSARDGIEGMKLGAFDYLMKPLRLEDLLEKLHEAGRLAQAAQGNS
ncbi:response regulator [Nitratidesulfovibrio liaohensis]|uniref:Response regulator n=1 Tax=Nitratidesulfovibrio liaohensis TaxID=2604158 RepID=A0ABY9QYA1_9BACT|nr:response regulator [Nitratidesulfovibrio liaohensis]NHZ46446.1 response regulator [Nitratidesulfovibrio liaohensis]WMW64036.1 response regulator [Nitratidesulfovibrio liaohensis]